MRNLITAQEVIELAFAENSNMMAESISDTAIRIAEIKYIRPAFGVMYPLLADKYADFTNDYVKPALAYFVKCEIVSSIAIDMSNSGVAVANPQYQSAATDKQRQRLYDSEMSKAKTLLDFALEYIATHSEEFPDFSGEAPKKHHRVGGILLGDGTSRSQSASIAGEAFKNEIERLSKDVAGKVDKVEGKGLSSNDFTDEHKQKVEEFTIDKELSPTSDNAIANSAVVQGLAGLAEGVSKAIGNVAKNVEKNTADIKTKQDTLTLTTKPNGNIVIGNLAWQTKEFMPATPSGDPMHYAYEAVGAVWNASTGYWSYRAEEGGLSDLTNADMRLAYAEAYLSTAISEGVRFTGTARLLINKTAWVSAKAIGNSYCKNNNLEVAEIAGKNQKCIFATAYNCFNYNPKLHTILGILDYSYSSGAGSAPPYKECYALQNIKVSNLKHNIAFPDSSHLSKESLLYMINNCASNATFTIALHPDVYAKCVEGGEWYSDIDEEYGDYTSDSVNKQIQLAWTEKGTTITLASA